VFQLYKKRNFNALINDTFVFLKEDGRNFFGTYFKVIGGLLLIITVLTFVVMRVFFENMFNGFGSPEAQQMLETYFDENAVLFVVGGIIAAFTLIAISLITMSFPVIYLSLLEHVEKPTAQMIFARLKAKSGKIIVFALTSLITFLPIAAVLGGVSVFLFITIIGIPVALALWAALTCWVFLTFYNTLNGEGFFTAMGSGYRMLFQNFWAHMGSTAIFYVLSFVVQMALTLAMSLLSELLFVAAGTSDLEGGSIVGVIVFIISMLINYIFSNVLIIAHGMIYYSCKEDNEHKTLYYEIDQIGSDSE